MLLKLAYIIGNRRWCKWFKLYFDYFINTIQENYIQFIQDLTKIVQLTRLPGKQEILSRLDFRRGMTDLCTLIYISLY